MAWPEIGVQAQHVVEHLHLAVTVDASANSDGRNLERLGDPLCQFDRNKLQHHGEGAGVLQS